MQERLQKVLAKAGIASRRGAEELIRQGKVRVDGKVVTEMGTRVDPATQLIECNDIPVTSEEKKVYILLHKPVGYLSTVDDPQGRPIVTDLLDNVKERVYPVGRLDLDTEGALLLTNDGELAQKILHPSHEVNKTYEAEVQGRPDRKKLTSLSRGIMLEGRKTWPAEVEIVKTASRSTTIRITIHEGRKRQVRKMFDVIGHPVLKLKRTAYGRLRLGNLETGKHRYLSKAEIKFIFKK